MVGDRQLRPRHERPPPKNGDRVVRPARLLNSGTKTFVYRPLRIANATQSPLLRLPPEIRDRIYKFVLGGKTLHFFNNFEGNKQVQHDVCRASKCDSEAAVEIRNMTQSKPVQNYNRRHSRCVTSGVEGKKCVRLDLRLLSVCSQIHDEAALIPFTDNIFAFCYWRTMERLGAQLVPTQYRAIRTVCQSGMAFFEPRSKKAMTGLRSMYGFYEVNPVMAGLIRDKDKEADEVLFRVMSQYTRLQLKTAIVCAYHDSGLQTKSDPDLFEETCSIIEDWIKLPLEEKVPRGQKQNKEEAKAEQSRSRALDFATGVDFGSDDE